MEHWGWNIGGGILGVEYWGWNIGGGILEVEYWGWNIGRAINVLRSFYIEGIMLLPLSFLIDHRKLGSLMNRYSYAVTLKAQYKRYLLQVIMKA